MIRTILAYGRVASRTALAVPVSSLPNAIAVGPTRERGRVPPPSESVGGDPQQAVLDDAVGDVLLAQGAPDLGDLLHLEAAVFGDDHRPGVREFLAQLGDGLSLGLCGHGPPLLRHATGVRRWGPDRRSDALSATSPGRPSHGRWPPANGKARPTPRGGAAPLCLGIARRRPRSRFPMWVAPRSDPVDQPRPLDPGVGHGPAGAGCLRRSVYRSGDAPLGLPPHVMAGARRS